MGPPWYLQTRKQKNDLLRAQAPIALDGWLPEPRDVLPGRKLEGEKGRKQRTLLIPLCSSLAQGVRAGERSTNVTVDLPHVSVDTRTNYRRVGRGSSYGYSMPSLSVCRSGNSAHRSSAGECLQRIQLTSTPVAALAHRQEGLQVCNPAATQKVAKKPPPLERL